jgi:hypothetical protein
MQVRLVRVTTKSGARAERTSVIEADVVTIGRGSDNVVQLSGLDVSLRHAVLHLRSGEVFIEPVGGNRLDVNGRTSLEGHALRPDHEVRFGSHVLRLRRALDGEDMCLEIEELVKAGGEREALRERTRTSLADRRFPVRPLAWPAFLGVSFAFVAMPLVWGRFETSWSSGELASAHRFIATDCRTCHAVPFQRVRNGECTACHVAMGAHARSEELAAQLAGVRCADCHADHRGSSGLAHLEQALCSECHADLKKRFAVVRVSNAADFGSAETHPEFTLTHASESADTVQSEWRPDMREDPRLQFNHLRHVGQVVADRKSGEKRNMECSDCHRPDSADRLMLPVRFDEHCSSCHGMTFDERHPKREAVHGDLPRLEDDLVEFYAALALAGDPSLPAALRRERPGEPLSEAERRAPQAWAREQAAAAGRRLLEEKEEKACRNCHPVEAAPMSTLGYAIPAVRIPTVWLEQGGFAHGAHAVFECRSCHAGAAVFDPNFAPEVPRPAWSLEGSKSRFVLSQLGEQAASENSSDVLIPGSEVCRDCHGGPRAPEPAVASDCVLCHPFHRTELGPIESASR